MRPPLGGLSAALILALSGCATPRAALSEPAAAAPSALEGAECTPETLLALCAADGCNLYWCSVVAPALTSVEQLRRPGALLSLPGRIETRPPSRFGQVAPGTFLTRGAGAGVERASARPPTLAAEGERRDVIQAILLLRKPDDVERWWEAGGMKDPGNWTHPLTEWESQYFQALGASNVPEQIRTHPPATPERLTPELRRQAEEMFGRGPFAAQQFCNWENRRRIVVHYWLTHPSTVRIHVSLFRLTRDLSPVHFALERGWQVAGGREMLTEEEVSRLGAAAEFFAAVGLAVATGRLVTAVGPKVVEGVVRPPPFSRGVRLEGETFEPLPPGAKVIPLRSARELPGQPPEAPPMPAREEPLAATGTDGRPLPRSTTGRPSAARVEPGESAGRGGPQRQGTPPNIPPPLTEERAGFAALVNEAEGATPEVIRAEFKLAESAETGGRLPRNLEAVRRAKPSLEHPRPGVAPDSARWREYVAYYEQRLAKMEAADAAGRLTSVKPPLSWSPYEALWDTFTRGLKYQRARTAALRNLAEIRGFSKPHIQANAGVFKADLRYADVLIIETDPTRPLRVEAYSFKSRTFRGMNQEQVEALLAADARNALKYYGGELDIRTPALGLRGRPVKVDKVHLRYDADPRLWEEETLQNLLSKLDALSEETGVEVRFE